MKLLITGCLGHIGTYVLENIDKLGKFSKIILVDNLKKNKINNLLFIKNNLRNSKFIDIDLSQVNSYKKIENADIVLHFASMTDAEGSIKIRKEIYRNNLKVFNNILHYMKKNKNAKLIHISSTSVYGKSTGLVDESEKNLLPQTPYAEIKLIEEKLIRKKLPSKRFVTLRFGTIAGLSRGIRFHTAVNKFCLNAVLKLPIPVWKNAYNQFRPYLSLSDALKSLNFIIKKNIFDGLIYNILSNNFRVKDILAVIKKKQPINLNFINSKIINQNSYKVSNKNFKIKGFRFKGTLDQEILMTLKKLNNLNNN